MVHGKYGCKLDVITNNSHLIFLVQGKYGWKLDVITNYSHLIFLGSF